MTEQQESIGRIEVTPEVLVTIARYAVQEIEGVQQMVPVPNDVARLFQRGLRQDGVLLDLSENKLRFNIYVIMAPHVNLLETSRAVQHAVSEAIDTIVGIPVDAVNVFVEDVHYNKGEVV